MRKDSGFSEHSLAGPGAGAGAGDSAGDSGATVASPVMFEGLLAGLAELDPECFDEATALDLVTALERVKRAAAAAQARLSVRVDQLARNRQRGDGVPTARLGIGVGAQVALARMESPHRGRRHLGLAKVLVAEMPHTLAAMTSGRVSEWQATIVARETACLDADTRRDIDLRIADRLPSWGDRQTEREVRSLAYAADPGAAVRRHARAAADRHVSIRPAPDTMCYLTALLPAVQGVACYAALVRAADQARAAGDPRGKGQAMADTAVERLTGQTTAPDTPVEVDLLMPANTLLGHDHTPAHLSGYGPLPAAQARGLVRDTRAAVWVRRLYTQPDTRRLVAMDTHRRTFTGQLRKYLILRDQFCRTPWCDAPIRHTDHAHPHHDQGATDHTNGQGLCEACNYAKEAPGWHQQPMPVETGHRITITTPTSHEFTSCAPDPPGVSHDLSGRPQPPASRLPEPSAPPSRRTPPPP